MQVAQCAPRLDAEPLDQRPACRPIRLERLRLSPRAIQRQHQLRAQALTERILVDQRLELPDQLVVSAAGQLSLVLLLNTDQASLIQPRDLTLREALVREIAQRRATPERQRLAQPSLLAQAHEPLKVQLVRTHA